MSKAVFYTLTPNPALDLSGHVKSIVPNEKNYVFDERRDPGGNGINAARIAHRLKAPTFALGFLGGPTGIEIQELLKREGVPFKFTPIKNNTRVNVTVTNDSDHKQTRLTFPGPEIATSECRTLYTQLTRLKKPGILAIGGSLPKGIAKGFHQQIAHQAHQHGLGVIVDVPGPLIQPVLGAKGFKALLIKPNQVELGEWSGSPVRGDAEIRGAARRMLAHAAIVCVSLAEEGALLVTSVGEWRGIPPQIEARGTVGAGDSMVGAMAAFLVKKGLTRPEQIKKGCEKILEDMLRWGLAGGAATAQVTGTRLADPKEIRRLYEKVGIERLSG